MLRSEHACRLRSPCSRPYAVLLPHGQVLVEALPPKWEGRLLFAEHMAGFVSIEVCIVLPSTGGVRS